MCTARFSDSWGGVFLQRPRLNRDFLWTETPLWTEIPLDIDPLWTDAPSGRRLPSGQRCHPLDRDPALWTETLPSGQRLLERDPLVRDPLDRDPLDRNPLEGTWDQGQRHPRRNMGSGSQTGNNITQRPPWKERTHNFWKHYLALYFVWGW